jgi:hypothetical protein
MKLVARAWLGAVVLLAAVATPALAADPVVSGRILDVAGRPAAGVPVALVARRSTAADIVGAFAAVLTVGVSCLAGIPPCDRTPSSSTTTDAGGRYSFDGVATAKVGASIVLVAGAPGGPTVRAQLTVDRVLDLGDLRMWEPGLQAQSAGPRTTLSWTAPLGADDRTVVHLSVVGPRVRLVAGGATGAKGSASYDRRAVEDAYVEAILDAGFSRPRAGTNIRVDWTSAPRQVPAAGPPASRGRACTAGGAAVSPCPVTDGDMVAPAAARELVVDLGGARYLDVVAIAGTFPQGIVEASADRTTWRPLPRRASAGGWPADVFEASGPAARWIRVKAAAADQPMSVGEVSAWPAVAVPIMFPPRPAGPTITPLPDAAAPAVTATTPTTAPPAAGPVLPAEPTRRMIRPALGAFALIVLVSLATCVVAARATRPRRPRSRRPPPPPAWPGVPSPPAAGWPVAYQSAPATRPAWPG